MASFPTYTGDVSQAPGRDPAFRDPAFRDPAFRDPAFRDPALRDPAFRDPAFRDPAFRDPALRDPGFMEAINQRMRVPERLSISPGQQWGEEGRKPEDPPPAYSMHIPDRLIYTDAPDMSPRPVSAPSKPGLYRPLGPEACWERQPGDGEGDVFYREALQSPMRRSYSDQTFGRTPPVSPSQAKQALTLHSQVSLRRSDGPLHHCSSAPAAPSERQPQPHPQPQLVPLPLGLPALPPNLLSPQSMLRAARDLGQQASQRLLQTVSHKYSFRSRHPDSPSPATVAEASAPVYVEQGRKSATESWSLEEEGGAAVELIVLRRQVVKMSRRLAGLERQNAERRQTEVVLFSLLLSACLLNAWLWIRR